MTILIRIASLLLQGSLALFPPGYRREYGEEHACVLRLAQSEAAGCGRLFLLRFIAREGGDLPFALLRAHQKEWKEVRMRTNRILVLIGGFILILGSRLPWMSVPVLYGVEGPAFEAIEIGWEGDGFITGGIGLILLLVGIFWRGRIEKRYSIPGAILAALAVLMIIGDFYRILEIDPDAGFFAATDVGIYVTLIGALLAFVGALYRTPVDQERQGTMYLSSSL